MAWVLVGKTRLLCRLQKGSFPSSLNPDPSTALLTSQARDEDLPPPKQPSSPTQQHQGPFQLEIGKTLIKLT